MLTVRLSFRLKYGIYEDIESLFINLVLSLLIIVLIDKAFSDYDIFKEIKDIPLSKNGFLYYLRVKNEIFNLFFF